MRSSQLVAFEIKRKSRLQLQVESVLRLLPWCIPGFREISNELQADWEYAQTFTDPQAFVEKEVDRLRTINFGFNYSPFHMADLIAGKKLSTSAVSSAPTAILDWFANLNLNSGRMEVRFGKVLDKNLSFVPDNYSLWMDSFLKYDVKLIINPGLKAARWPEIHLDHELLDTIYSGKVPYGKRKIHSDDALALFSFNLQQEIYSWLKENYLKTLLAIQPENEPTVAFGYLNWSLHRDYLQKSMEIAYDMFNTTQVPLMINSPMVLGFMQETAAFLENFKLNRPDAKLLMGVNHYYRHPFSFLLSQCDIGDTYAFTQLGARFWGDLAKVQTSLQAANIPTITTELQLEPWYPSWDSPGNSFNEFVFIILRNLKFLNGSAAAKSLVLLWGTEELYLNSCACSTQDSKKILALIKLVNALN